MRKEKRKPRPQQFRRRKRRPCIFCVEKKELDYKDVGFVRRFMTDRGKIAPRRITGCCALHQRMVAQMIKRTRQIGQAPYTVD